MQEDPTHVVTVTLVRVRLMQIRSMQVGCAITKVVSIIVFVVPELVAGCQWREGVRAEIKWHRQSWRTHFENLWTSVCGNLK